MLRKVCPKIVLCYGVPFDEMEGKIIAIDYAKTNNLTSKAEQAIYNKKFSGYICFEKGMGIASSSSKVSLPMNNSQLKHIFGNREGHVPDTPQNRQKLIELANNSSKYLGKDKYGNTWHAEINSNGEQWWVRFREKIVNEGGLNARPKQWDPQTGLNNNPFK